MVLDRKFTEEEIQHLMHLGAVTTEEDDEPIFEVVKEEVVDFDTEKSSTTIEYVIKECATNKYYKARLSESPWIYQTEANCKVIWEEVFPKKIITEVYE